jgi:hypothetical protein
MALRGLLGLDAPTIGGRGMNTPDMSRTTLGSRGLGTSSISSAATGGGAPPVKNLGARIISALRARRKGMGAPRGMRRM